MITLDLDTFAKTLTEKGYDGYFLTDTKTANSKCISIKNESLP